MNTYRVTYRAMDAGWGVKTINVTADTTDEARTMARRLDPDYIATVKTPRKVRKGDKG